MKNIKLIITLGTLTLLPMIGTANPLTGEEKPAATSSKLDQHDQTFLKHAAEMNMLQIELGKVAEKISTDPNIKKIGADLQKDHSATMEKLESLASSKGVTLPSELSAADRSMIQALEKKAGEKFDHEFLTLNAKEHEKALKVFQNAIGRTKDSEIKSWAEQMVPKLQEHLNVAKSGLKMEPVGEKKQHKSKY